MLTPDSLRRVAALLLVLGFAVPPATAAEPRFAITDYEVSGNTLLSEASIRQALAPFTGPESTFQTIQQAVKALEQQYADAGYGSVRIVLPEQEVADGRVRVAVIEARIGEVAIEGNSHFDAANIRASVPGIAEGSVPRMDDISASLRVANENGAKLTTVVFRPSAQEKSVDAILRVADEPPLKLGATLDNSGTEETGKFRLGLLMRHSNLFNSDHAASVQVVTSPGHQSDVKIFGLGYRIPLYRLGDSIDLAFGYSSVNSGRISTAGGDFGISGSGRMFSAKYNVYLPKLGDWDQKLTFGIDYRNYRNQVQPAGGGASLVPDATVRPLSLTYAGQMRNERFDLAGYLTYAHNLPGGADGSKSDFDRSRLGAKASYDYWRYGADLTYRFGSEWSLRGAVAGQHTDDRLISPEMFGIGGHDSVRGFEMREVADDKGHRGTLEVYTPDFGGRLGVAGLRAQALAFYDVGRVSRNGPLPGEARNEGIASTGLGLRLGYARNLSVGVDFGVVTQPGAGRQRGDGRLHGNLLWLF